MLQGTDCEHLYCQFSRVDTRAYLIVLYNDKMVIFKIFITSSRRLYHQRNQHGVIRGTVGSVLPWFFFFVTDNTVSS